MPGQKSGFERYSLSGNPFRDLAAETLDRVDIFHSKQNIDEELNVIWEEVSDKENSTIIAVLAGLGMGKTQRLLLTAQYANDNGHFWVMKNIMPDTKYVAKGLIERIMETVPISSFERYFWTPKWYRDLRKSVRGFPKKYDPHFAGKSIAEALNRFSPSFLLLNDLQNIPTSEDLEKFLQTLYVLINEIDPGVLIMTSSNSNFFNDLMKGHEALAQRFNVKMKVPVLKEDEACLLIARRLLGKRIVEDLDPLYPFTKQAVYEMNYDVVGNPRQLLKLADRVIESAAKKKAMVIDEKFVGEFLADMKGQKFLPPAKSKDLVCYPEQDSGRVDEIKVRGRKTASKTPDRVPPQHMKNIPTSMESSSSDNTSVSSKTRESPFGDRVAVRASPPPGRDRSLETLKVSDEKADEKDQAKSTEAASLGPEEQESEKQHVQPRVMKKKVMVGKIPEKEPGSGGNFKQSGLPGPEDGNTEKRDPGQEREKRTDITAGDVLREGEEKTNVDSPGEKVRRERDPGWIKKFDSDLSEIDQMLDEIDIV